MAQKKGNVAVYLVGKIDIKIYQCVTKEIRSNEVIITNERINYIINRRGIEFYDRYAKRFVEIIENPDYIFADKDNTALVCKEFVEDGKYINIVLRLAISTDNFGYKNSIITVVGESDKRFRQRLRNNVPLYKKE